MTAAYSWKAPVIAVSQGAALEAKSLAVTPAGATMAAPCTNPANMTYMPASRARSYRDARPASSPK